MSAGARAQQFAVQLRDRLARHPRNKALVGWQSYFRSLLEDAPGRGLVDHRGPHVGNDARQRQLIDAIAAGGRAVLVSAPPGCGKSRFALELARRLGQSQRSWDVRFVRQDDPALEAELRELPPASRSILIVDDAQDGPALVQRLAALCSAPGPSPRHLVCLTRPVGRAALAEALANHLPAGELLQMDLGRPDAQVLRALVDALIPQLSPHHRDLIRRHVADSFFAAVLLCSSAARQKRLPQTLSAKNLRDYAVRQPIAEAVGDLCAPEKAMRALAVYAACAPVRAGDAAIRSSAAAHADLEVCGIEALERRILDAGLFESDARGRMRPHPDLIGDLILEETCFDEEGRPTPFGRSLLRGLLEQGHCRAVVANCGDCARLLGRPERVEFLSDLLLERIAGLSPQSRAEAAGLLEGCAPLAVRQPDLAVHLIETLESKGVLREALAADGPSAADGPQVRAQRLLMSAAVADPALVPRALEYSRQVLARARGGDGARRLLQDGLREFCQFAVARPLAHAAAVLEVLQAWSADPDEGRAELAGSLVRGFLPLQMQTRSWEGEAQTLVSTGLEAAERICALRDRALDILLRCADHATPAVAYAAVASLGQWARGYAGLADELRRAWHPRLAQELERLAAAFARLGAQTAHLPVRAAVEQQGWEWWIDGAEPFIRRGGGRLLAALPGDEPYSLWKALHAAALPVFPVPLEEALEPQCRRGHLLPLVEPPAARRAELAAGLFDRLDARCHDSAAWSALLASVAGAQPRQPAQPGARAWLQEFVRRHPEAAWSLVGEDVAAGPLGTLLPALLAALRAADTPRWHEAIQGAVPGTRLFEIALGVLCTAGDLDSVELATVSRGLELEGAEVVHLCARALLDGPASALLPGLAAVFAALPRRAADACLWELTLDAFAGWGAHLLALPADAEADPAARAAAGELLRLLRTYGSALSWREGPHVRRLADVLAILAVAVPHTLKSWIRQEEIPAADVGSDAVLSAARFCAAVRLLSKSAAAAFWQKQLAEWITEEPGLAAIGGRALAQLCGLGDPCIGPLVMRIVRQPSESSLEALRQLVGSCWRAPRFVEDVVTLFRALPEAPQAYELLEEELIARMAGAGRMQPAAIESRNAALDAIDRAVQDSDLPQALRRTLARARQAIQGTIEEGLLRDEAH